MWPQKDRRTDQTHDRFLELHQHLMSRNDFFTAGPVATPPLGTNPRIVKTLRKLIEDSSKELPAEYQKGYSDPLLDNLEQICDKMLSQPNGLWGLASIANAAIQAAPGSGVHNSVRRLHAVIADIYTSFLSSNSRNQKGLKLNRRLPPLGAFTAPIFPPPPVSPPPQMYSVDRMKKLSDRFTAGVVNLPSGYRTHPLLWSILAHEVGGHDVLHADEGLLPELQRGIKGLFPGQQNKLSLLWGFWAEETGSDVCGVLNLGPAYGLGAIVFHTTVVRTARDIFEHRSPDGGDHHQTHEPILDTQPNSQLPIDAHPIAALIPYVIIGATEKLTTLNESTKTRYISQIQKLAKTCTPYRKTVDLTDYVITDGPGRFVKFGASLPFDVLKESALAVGRHIASTKFLSLRNTPLQEIETWDDADEKVSHDIANTLANDALALNDIKQENGSSPEDAQILAGAILAAFRRPDRYDIINDTIGEAFDRSYDDDPLIHLAN